MGRVLALIMANTGIRHGSVDEEEEQQQEPQGEEQEEVVG